MKHAMFPRFALALLLLTAAGTAAAQTEADPKKPAPSHKANTIKQVPSNSVGDSIQRGTNAAGRGISKADSATRSGIAKGSEAASRPVRNLGDSIGRKLGLGTGSTGPARGPQSEQP